MKSLSSLHLEYDFTMNYFLELFDEAIGGDLPEDFVQPRDTPERRAARLATAGASSFHFFKFSKVQLFFLSIFVLFSLFVYFSSLYLIFQYCRTFPLLLCFIFDLLSLYLIFLVL